MQTANCRLAKPEERGRQRPGNGKVRCQRPNVKSVRTVKISANITGKITANMTPNITGNITADIRANIRALISKNIMRIIVGIIVRIVKPVLISIIVTVLITIIIRIIVTNIEAKIETEIMAIMTPNIVRIIAGTVRSDTIPQTAPFWRTIIRTQAGTAAVRRFLGFPDAVPLKAPAAGRVPPSARI